MMYSFKGLKRSVKNKIPIKYLLGAFESLFVSSLETFFLYFRWALLLASFTFLFSGCSNEEDSGHSYPVSLTLTCPYSAIDISYMTDHDQSPSRLIGCLSISPDYIDLYEAKGTVKYVILTRKRTDYGIGRVEVLQDGEVINSDQCSRRGCLLRLKGTTAPKN